ncbi:flagellar assembly protein FliH [Motilibacter peucedani]|uniref:Flagellar assembly protein FliH n=1 Tax=Motilibacter peucedani TaxID=598650 RepID=A0A420XTH1_9ACTN|nr:FliH/SctL family protein [Motilibacter peucedani]RKS80133.1 flagellar assembly protein FliH [Motilibacter peucedani]
MSSSTEFLPGVERRPAFDPAPAVRAAQIDQRLAAATVSPEKVREQAQAEGFSVGWAAGHRAAAAAVADQTATLIAQEQARYQAKAARLDAALAVLEQAAADLARRSAPQVDAACELIATTAYDVAEALVAHDLRTTRTPGMDAVQRALAAAPAEVSQVLVRLNPDDAATLHGLSQDGLPVGTHVVTLVADPSLRSGDSVAECGATTLDARIAPALARVKEILSP